MFLEVRETILLSATSVYLPCSRRTLIKYLHGCAYQLELFSEELYGSILKKLVKHTKMKMLGCIIH